MKKIIIITALSLFVASSAFAAGGAASLSLSTTMAGPGLSVWGAKTGVSVTAGVPAAGTLLIGKTSTGVGVGMAVDAAAGAGYSVETQHKNGTKAYGTAHDSTSIFQKDVVAGTPDTTSLATGASSFVGVSGWTSM